MSTSNMQSIQHSNYSDIYHLLYNNDKLAKQDIADQLNLSLPTVTSNLQRLIEQGLVIKNGQLKSLIGRRATAYSINANGLLGVGIEIFRNYATVAILNLKNEVQLLHTFELPFSNTTEYCQTLSNQLLNLIEDHNIQPQQILSAGIGIQGLISNDGNTILYGKILDCEGMKTSDFAQYLPFSVTFYHDADCVAIAEHVSLPTDGIFMSIGEHLGTAIILNNQILKSSSGRNGTMEHISLNSRDGRLCYCGRRGCIETYCSLNSLLHDNETTESFFDKLNQNDQEVRQRFETYLDYLAQSIYNLHMFVDIPIILAGEITKYLTTEILTDLKNRLKELSVFPEDESYLQFGSVLKHSVAIGASIPAIQNKINNI
ncbi:ROK family protein [Lentilactobacillus senioris]|uniref:ROK family protein n=1 Tax=Lentilactobacillus senioris TaxID=931534 RepID=UPI003D26C2B0